MSPTRDFTYVEDTVDAFISAIKSKNLGEIINVGSKFEISIKDILNIFKKDFGYNFEIMIDKQRLRPKNSEVQRLFSSSIKAKKLLGWSPKYNELSGFKKGLEKTLNWFSNVENIKFYKSNIYNI